MSEQDNKPEMTAIMILIEHEQGVLERMSTGFVHPQHIQQQKDRMECLNKLLAVEKIQWIESHCEGNLTYWKGCENQIEIEKEAEEAYNEKYATDGK
jgi:hypothetical protein